MVADSNRIEGSGSHSRPSSLQGIRIELADWNYQQVSGDSALTLRFMTNNRTLPIVRSCQTLADI